MWTCPKCRTKLESSYEVCWNCGTATDGSEDPSFVTADQAGAIDDPHGFLDLDTRELPGDELPRPPTELVACFRSNSLVEARFVANELDAGGIPIVLQNMMHGDIPGSMDSQYPYGVVVRIKDLPRAQSWVEEYQQRLSQRRGEL